MSGEEKRVFIDTTGREWRPVVTLPVAREIQRQAGINLLDADALLRTGENLNLQIECLWQSVAAAAKARDVKREDFEAALDADVLEAASDAFMFAVVDFFPAAKRPLLRRVLAEAAKQQQEAAARMEKLLPGTGQPSPTSAPEPDSPAGPT